MILFDSLQLFDSLLSSSERSGRQKKRFLSFLARWDRAGHRAPNLRKQRRININTTTQQTHEIRKSASQLFSGKSGNQLLLEKLGSQLFVSPAAHPARPAAAHLPRLIWSVPLSRRWGRALQLPVKETSHSSFDPAVVIS